MAIPCAPASTSAGSSGLVLQGSRSLIQPPLDDPDDVEESPSASVAPDPIVSVAAPASPPPCPQVGHARMDVINSTRILAPRRRVPKARLVTCPCLPEVFHVVRACVPLEVHTQIGMHDGVGLSVSARECSATAMRRRASRASALGQATNPMSREIPHFTFHCAASVCRRPMDRGAMTHLGGARAPPPNIVNPPCRVRCVHFSGHTAPAIHAP